MLWAPCALLLRGKAQLSMYLLEMTLLPKQCVLSVGVSVGTWLLSQLWKLLAHSLICLVWVCFFGYSGHTCARKGQMSLCPWFQVMLICCLQWCSFPVRFLQQSAAALWVTSANQGWWSLSHPPQMKKQVHLLLCIIFLACPTGRLPGSWLCWASAHIWWYPDVHFQGRVC